MCRHRQQQCKCATWIQFSISSWALSKLNACSNVTQILPRLWALKLLYWNRSMIHLVLLRSTDEACQNINQGLDQDFRSVTQCLTQLETWQQSANHGWLISPHLHLLASQEISFLHWVKVSVLEATCRKIPRGPVVFWEATACKLLLCTCKVGLWLGCLLEPGLGHRPSVLTCLPSPGAKDIGPHSPISAKSCKMKNDSLCSCGQGDNIRRTAVLLRSLCVSVLLINKHLPHSLEEDARVVTSEWQSMALRAWIILVKVQIIPHGSAVATRNRNSLHMKLCLV